MGRRPLPAGGDGAPSAVRRHLNRRTVDLRRGITGLALEKSLSLCFDEADACASTTCTTWRQWPRTTLLHELAHVWMTDKVSHAQREADADHPWAERGVELAASTIAGALMPEPLEVSSLFGPRSCTELTDLVGLLIGPTRARTPRCMDQ